MIFAAISATTAFLPAGGQLAVAAVEVLRRLRFSVPADVSLVPRDDPLACQQADPPLSALDTRSRTRTGPWAQ